MPRKPELYQAIQRGLDYLTTQQLPGGGFLTYLSPELDHFEAAQGYETVFAPALIAGALAPIKLPAAASIREQACRFILDQKSPAGSFNYWAKSEPERRQRSYPDDLDDTFCALNALTLHDPELVTEKMLAQAVKLLLSTESTPGGPYKTWLVSNDSGSGWQDIDPAVNANIGYFLSLHHIEVPPLRRYLEVQIEDHALESPYYPSRLPATYYLSRFCPASHQTALAELARQQLTAASHPLAIVLAAAALGHVQEVSGLDVAVKELLQLQNPDGSWPAGGFWIDTSRQSVHSYMGSAALTTAFALEALQLYADLRTPQKADRPAASSGPDLSFSTSERQSLTRLARKQTAELPLQFRQHTLGLFDKILDSEHGAEIALLPKWFADSLRPGVLTSEAARRTTELGLANSFGWLAYTIYDDFLDDEGKPRLLPIANATLRRSLDGFLASAARDGTFIHTIQQTFDTIDAANAWELRHARLKSDPQGITLTTALPYYGSRTVLAERSLGHMLGPLSILALCGYGPATPEATNVSTALRQYLIVRQLNDDCHDWQEDVRQGHISFVVAAILKELDLTGGWHSFEELVPTMQRQFWHETLPKVCKIMQKHLKQGREAAEKVTILNDGNIVCQLLDSTEAAVQNTIQSREQAVEFLMHYQPVIN